MDDINGCCNDLIARDVTLEGHHLRVLARLIDEESWELAIENELGVRSVWFEWFPTAQAALDAGLNAIQDEGVDTFVDVEGFDYLQRGSGT